MFLGGDKFLHAPHTGDVVKVSSLSEPYYASQFAGGRRFDDAAGVAAVPAAAPAAAPVAAAAAAARRAGDRPDRGRQGAGRGRPRRRRGPPQQLAALPGDQGRRGVQGTREEQLDDVPQGGRPVAGQAPRGGRRRAGRARAGRRGRVAAGRAGAAAAAAAPRRRAAPPPEASPAAPAATRRRRQARRRRAVAIDLTNAATEYPGNNASQAELAKWLAKQADAAGLPPELPVMASLVESGVKNLNFGDADSVGFFQMRVGIWNKGAYAGYPEKPELQAKWFIDQALAVKSSGSRRATSAPTRQVRRVDRRRRAPRRAVPRPLSAAARRSPQAAHVGLEPAPRHRGGQVAPPGHPPRRRDLLRVGQEADGVQHVPVRIVGQPARPRAT